MSGLNTANPRRFRPWLIALPLLLVLVLAGGWSVYWVGATRFAAEAMDRLIEREARRGRVITCEQREQGGFPFRFEVTCLRPGISWQSLRGPATARLEKLSVVALAYNLGHVIVELNGPALVELPPRGTWPQKLRLEWESARSSLVMDILGDPAPREFALTIDQLSVWTGFGEMPTTDASRPPVLQATHVESHGRRREAENPPSPDYDISFDADQVTLHDLSRGPAPLAELNRVEFLGTAFSIPFMETRNLNAFAALWQERGGHLAIERLWIEEKRTTILANGELSATQEGLINGNVTLAVTGVEAIATRFDTSSGEQSQIVKLALGALGMIGKPVSIENRRGVEIPLLFRDGEFSLGGFLKFKLPPLFSPTPS